MSIIKSFSVGRGDMFYIKHNSDNFTIIDCCLEADVTTNKAIVDEIIRESGDKNITRFISTHPDEDHFIGLEYLNKRNKIYNFYCVRNEATKPTESNDFNKYCELRDSDIAFYIHKGCSRKWMNQKDENRGSAGIEILWPNVENKFYKEELIKAKKGESFNNISTIVKYSCGNVTFLWMGDIETAMMENIKDELDLPKVNILFAPHHGRDSGKVPKELLDKMNPDIVIIGEAPAKDLHYYPNNNTITQNSAENITFETVDNKIHIYTSNETHNVSFLKQEKKKDGFYIGTLNT